MRILESLKRYGRTALIVPPLLVGIVVLAVVRANLKEPARRELDEVARPLRVISATEMDVVPRVLGYGTARPRDIWTAVAEVKGRIVQRHLELKAGSIIKQGELVLSIDSEQYDLQVKRIDAEIAQIQAQLEEMDVQKSNYQQSLTIEKQSLAVAERELVRLRDLRNSNAIAESTYDESLRRVLSQQQSVLSLESQLKVLPSQKLALQSALAAKQASLGQAKIDQNRTELTAPFDCRLSDVSLEVGQFVNVGQVLFEADGSAATEVEAQVPINRLRTLLSPRDDAVDLTGDVMQMIRQIFDVQVVVRMRSGDFVVQWEGRFDRIREELDPQTRTLQVVVVVDKPYEGVVPGKRPPLSPGMFCEVEMRAKPRLNRLVIPRICVHDDFVYLVDANNRLIKRPVVISFSQGAISVVSEGLTSGETLVVSDPMPAIETMLVEPKMDDQLTEWLMKEAAGEGGLR